MPLRWFRRRKADEEQAPSEAAAPAVSHLNLFHPTSRSSDAAPAADGRRQRDRRKEAPPRHSRRSRPETEARRERRAAADRPPSAEPRRGRAPAARRGEARRAQAHARQPTASARPRRTPPRRAPLPKAKRELIVSVDAGEKRVAVLEDDVVAEVYLERPEHRSIAGNVYLGTVDNVLPGHGGRVRRDRPREERLPLRRRDRRPRARGPQGRAQDPGPDPARPDDPRPGGQGPDEDEGRAAHDRDLAARPLRRLRPARRRARRLAPARRRRAQPAEGDPQGDRARSRAASSSAPPPRARRPRTSSATSTSSSSSGRRSRRARRRRRRRRSIYQEAELPLRVTRDLFTGEFERLVVDHDRTYKRIVGYLKKTSPHMVERVTRYKERAPLMEASGRRAGDQARR